MKTLGDYEYDEKNEIGRGAFGVVYKGRSRTNLAQLVAIKVVLLKGYQSKDLRDSINRETEILKTLSSVRHTNIVTLLHCEKQEDYAYFVMEFCNAVNLQEYLQSRQKLDESTIRTFLRQIAAGLKVAHDMHIVHRDLKPENILLCFSGPKYPNPDNITLKIDGFGIGRFLNDDEMARTLCGTMKYMAPEVLFGRPYDYKVDLWSVGVMAYECFMGSLPQNSSIALHGVEITKNTSPEFTNLLNGLLEMDENKRLNMKQFCDHQFLAATSLVSVVGSDNQSKMMHVKDSTHGSLRDIMKTVGEYEFDVENEIRRGTFGIVYKGRKRTNLAMVVAIKEVDVENYRFSHDTKNTETKILETLSSPRHKNIVTLLHCERQGHFVHYVMEFCNGGNLQEYLQSKQKLEENTIRIFLKQIADGLKAAHDMKIIHRDLKPENILLCFYGPKYPSPDKITLKIDGFGIARFLNSDEMARTCCGTPLYMAPEIILQRRGGYEYKADLWTVGVIAYECLVGSLQEVPFIALHGVEIPTNISPDFANLLNGLLENDENKRFNMKQFSNHQFLAANISVYVAGPDNHRKIIHIKDNQSVDHLMDIVFEQYNTDSEAAYLVHEDHATFERGSGNSLRESGIVHNSTVTLVLRLCGGNDNDGKEAPDGSSSVSRQNCMLYCKDTRVY